MSDIKKVVLAYSGGLDTSVILKWLQDHYHCEIVTFTADLGQGEELEPARTKAIKFGIKPENIFIDDLREEFVRDFVFPMFRANAIYEGEYLLAIEILNKLVYGEPGHATGRHLLADAFDVHRGADPVDQRLEAARRAGAVRAAVLHLALRLDHRRAAQRAVCRHLPVDRPGAVLAGGYQPAMTANPRPWGMPPFAHLLDDGELAAMLAERLAQEGWLVHTVLTAGDAERALVGCAFIDPAGVVGMAMGFELREESFVDPIAQSIWGIISKMLLAGEPVVIEGSDLLARAIQHETDHLDGILFVDRLDPEQRREAMRLVREADWGATAPVVRVSPHAGAFGHVPIERIRLHDRINQSPGLRALPTDAFR